MFRARKADRLHWLYWEGPGSCSPSVSNALRRDGSLFKRLEEHFATSPARAGLVASNNARFEAPFAGLDWQRVRAIAAKASEAVD